MSSTMSSAMCGVIVNLKLCKYSDTFNIHPKLTMFKKFIPQLNTKEQIKITIHIHNRSVAS